MTSLCFAREEVPKKVRTPSWRVEVPVAARWTESIWTLVRWVAMPAIGRPGLEEDRLFWMWDGASHRYKGVWPEKVG